MRKGLQHIIDEFGSKWDEINLKTNVDEIKVLVMVRKGRRGNIDHMKVTREELEVK